MGGTLFKNILVVDDDDLYAESVSHLLTDTNTVVKRASSISDAKLLCQSFGFEVVLLDQHLDDGRGLDLLPHILSVNNRAKVIFATAYPDIGNAVSALKQGAYDYISKPVNPDELGAIVSRAFEASRLEGVEEVSKYVNERRKRHVTFIGTGNKMDEILRTVQKAAKSDAPVLITGETGTGKNVIAKLIHYSGADADASFISLNCATLPETLVEAELFGSEKGSYTGATQTRKGVFELADGGTLFLDEIGEMSPALQAKLLTAIEEKRIRRIGGGRDLSVNVRIIAATNIDALSAVDDGNFRRDLFYRLSVIRIHIPPLRERREDIAPLCRSFIDMLAPTRKAVISPSEVERLMQYDFPGNIRELRNIIERSLILQEGDTIYPSQLIETGTRIARSAGDLELPIDDKPLAEVEREYILAVFDRHAENITHTSKALGISLSTLKRKLRDYGVR